MKKSTNISGFINELTLKKFHISNITVSREENFNPPAKIKIENGKDFEETENGDIAMHVHYTLNAIEKEKEEPGFTISVTYTLIYHSKVKITKTIFKKFSKSLDVETWPYFRNLVNELTMRMGFPPLVLDILKITPREAKKKDV